MGQITVGEKIELQEKVGFTVVKAVYPIQPKTGRGLFQVKSSRDGLCYAMKVFDRAQNAVADIEREMVILNNHNQHPHLFPRFRGAFQAGGMACSIMDWMDGSGFDKVTAGRPAGTLQDVRFRVRMLISLCESIDLLHHNRYWHRDLKPENVLLRDPKDPGRGVVVIDFGLVAARRNDEDEGTYGYHAPEQSGRRNLSLGAHTDIYAIGQIGWYLLAGDPLYRDVNDDSNGWSASFEPLQDRVGAGADLPAGLEEALLKALSFDPRQRHRSVRELKFDLFKFSR